MSGFYLLFVAVVWLALTVVTAYAITSWIKDAILRAVAMLALIGLLLPLPLVDELVGERQFEQLCKDNSTIQVDRATAVGRTVYLEKTTDVEIKDAWIRIVMKQWRFVDAKSGELVVSYNTLQAAGGRVSQALGLSEGRAPLTFVKHYCAPKDEPGSVSTFEALGIKYIEPPKREN